MKYPRNINSKENKERELSLNHVQIGEVLYERYIIKQKCDFFITSSHATEKDLLRYNKNAKCKTVYRISEPKENKTKINKKKYYDYFGINKDNVVFLNYGRPGKTKGIFVE